MVEGREIPPRPCVVLGFMQRTDARCSLSRGLGAEQSH